MLKRNRSIHRGLIFIVMVIALIAFSWAFTRSNAAANAGASAEDYFAHAVHRTGAKTDQLIGALQTHLRSSPNDWQAYSQLALAYLQKVREVGDPTYYQKAEGVLKKALDLQPDDYVAISAMGALQLARHQFADALTWGQRANTINPARPYAYGVIADAQIELGQYDDAVTTLQTMVDLRPDLSSYSRISYIRELHGDTDGAIEMMQAAVDGGGPNPENSAWTRTQLGNLYFNSGNLQQAEFEYQLTLQSLPNYVYALAGLGHVRFAQGHTDQAIQLLTEASQAMPLPEFVIALGDVYAAAGAHVQAQQQYDLVGAIQQLYESNGVDLDAEIALFNADHHRDPMKTLQQARDAYAKRPSTFVADVVAWAAYEAGDYQTARSYSDQALRLGAKDALKFFHAGMIAKALGDAAQAQHYLEQALKINPNFSILYSNEARAALNDLTTVTQRTGY
jgi:tetratricopeptide (TPR) repeat protein